MKTYNDWMDTWNVVYGFKALMKFPLFEKQWDIGIGVIKVNRKENIHDNFGNNVFKINFPSCSMTLKLSFVISSLLCASLIGSNENLICRF
jgi:hypothetical protein